MKQFLKAGGFKGIFANAVQPIIHRFYRRPSDNNSDVSAWTLDHYR